MDGFSDIQTFEDFERETKAIVTPFRSRFGRLRWRDLDKPGPEYEYIIDDILTVGDKSVLGGPSQSGKSFLAIHMAMCIARGVPFFGRPVKRGLVIYQAGEGARGVKKRLRAYRKHFGCADEDVPFEFLQSRVDLHAKDGDTGAFIAECRAIAEEHGLPLLAVFIDTLATAQGAADENSGKDMGAVMANIDRINRETGAHVCLVHHLNADGKKLRGHTSIFANVDQVIMCVRDEATRVRTVTLGKMKDDADDVRFRFELMQVRLGEMPNGKPITSCVVLPVGEKAKLAEQSQGFDVRDYEREFLEALATAIDNHGEPVPAGVSTPSVVRTVVAREHVRAAYWDRYAASETGTQEEVEKALARRWKRAVGGLLKFKFIGSQEPYLWFTGREIRRFRLRGVVEPMGPYGAPAPQYEVDFSEPQQGGPDDN